MEYNSDIFSIRRIVESDINYLFRWWIDPEVNKFDPKPIPNSTNTLLKEVQWFCERFDHQIMNENSSERIYDYFIITNNEHPIGFINLFNKNTEKCEAELGIVLGDKRYMRRGIATNALQVVIHYIFEKMKLRRVYIETLETNKPAIKLFKKVGLREAGEYIESGHRFIIMEKLKK